MEEENSENTNQSVSQSTTSTVHGDRFVDLSATKRKIAKMKQESEEQETADYAKEMGLPYLDLNIFPITAKYITLVPEEEARKNKLVVVHKMDRELILGVFDPTLPGVKEVVDKLEKENGFKVRLFVVSQRSLTKAWEVYKRHTLVEAFDYMRMQLTGDDLKEFEKELDVLEKLGKRINEIPTTKLLNIIIAGAIKLEASDIHLEPEKNNRVRLRYRIDGVLHNVVSINKNVYPSIVSRVKILSKMMLNVYDVAQDGRFSIKIDDENSIDVRVSVLPGNYGENIVLRLLNQDISSLTLDKLGLTGKNYEWLLAQSEKRQGMIINSGPTGSGKTTTLYSLINKINSEEKKIISIEDPIEYQVPGVRQTQVEEERGYTFAEGLRAIVRQDPDVILVGEIRDGETADIAVNASLTGHLVLTTVHANTSAGVIGRIVDLGIKPAIIAPAVNAIIAQRLVRKLCEHCKVKYKPAQETVGVIKEMLSLISPKSEIEVPKEVDYLWEAKGCVKCNGLGYKGRVGIFEVMTIDEDIRRLIETMATEYDIRNASLEKGMITYEQDGIVKALRGETSLEEVQRVAGKGDYLLNLYEKIMIQTLSRGINIEEEVIRILEDNKGDYAKLKELVENASSKDKIKYILAAGLIMQAGDIHIEPGEKEFKVRYRIDGILHDIISLPMNEYLTVLNQIKELIGVKIQKREGVVDGRFRIVLPENLTEFSDHKIDVRTSIILGGYGDIVVMRLLNQTAQATELKKLGLREINLLKLNRNIKKPNGMVLNTGPTGSGKTTTLYSAIKKIAKPELKIITVEDPIEYQMDGILQTQVNEKENYTFATALRNLLRQNPDIIMIGEIRDEETAKIAYQAALTGHLVLSTLHTNNAAGSVRRLANMGISLSDMSSGTNCFMAQRLVRKLCEHCKREVRLSAEKREQIDNVLNKISPASEVKIPSVRNTYEAVGCPRCHGLGYSGRVPVAEVMEIDEEMEKYIVSNPTTTELQEKAIEQGMLTMGQDGVLRVVEGITTLEEVARISEEVELEDIS
jgi:type IV pilus assembly protein PilB